MGEPERLTAAQDRLRPAFRTKREGTLFVLLIVIVLALPFVPKRYFVSQQDIYRTLPPWNGSWNYFWSEVIPDSAPIDLLFLGDSTIARSIDPNTVRRALSASGSREPSVFAFSHSLYGYDFDYVFMKALLERKKVRRLVLQVEPRIPKATFWPWIYTLWDLSEHADVLWGLPPSWRFVIYAQASRAFPNHVLMSLRDQGRYPSLEQEKARGNVDPNSPHELYRRFRGAKIHGGDPAMPAPESAVPPEDLLLHRVSLPEWVKLEPRLGAYQNHFFDALLRLAQRHGVEVVLLHTPVAWDPRREIPIREMAPDSIGYELPIIAASLDQLFPGIDHAPFFDPDGRHMTAVGAARFTQVMTQALVRLYEKVEDK
jgi:hypothetical protein